MHVHTSERSCGSVSQCGATESVTGCVRETSALSLLSLLELSLCIFVCNYFCICVFVYLCICVFVYLCIYPESGARDQTRVEAARETSALPLVYHRFLFVYLCICVFVYLCICVSVYLSICVFVYL